MQSRKMLKSGNFKKHKPTFQSFKKEIPFNFKEDQYLLKTDKNGGVYEVLKNSKRDVYLFNQVKGNPSTIAINKIITELEYFL